MDRETLEAIQRNPELLVQHMARCRMQNFVRYMNPRYELTDFHRIYMEVLDKFAKGDIRKLIVSAPPQHGKALQVDTPVLTTKGWKRHGDLAPGDYVFGEDGTPKRVIANSGMYSWDGVLIDFDGDAFLVASPEHEWKVYSKDDDYREPTIVETKDLDKERHRISRKGAIFRIANIVSVGRKQVNCIEVEGGMYLAGYGLVPTHNSELSSRMLPAFLLGINPDLKIVIGSYNTEQARSFNRDVQRIINSDAYKAVFPDTFLNDGKMRMDNVYACNADTSEPVGHRGSLRAVGRSGALTGKSVDIMILDDLYKDFAEANSALIRNLAWKWYTTVVRTRYHNNSQELIVFTRWHEDDIIGMMEKSGEKIIKLKSWSDLDNVPHGAWLQLNFPALKVGERTEVDPREVGEPLWPEKHSKEKLLSAKSLDPVQFECLYQGDPGSAEGRLYGTFKTYGDKSEYGTFVRRGCYVDVADKGDDYLCSMTYDIYRSPNTFFNESTKRFEPILYALITDIIYTQEGTEVTTISVPQQINTQGSQVAWVESNNGGGQYATAISKKVKAQVKSFFTSGNKDSRLLTNVAQVMASIVFPIGWETKYPAVYNALTHFLRTLSANAHDDAPDCITGICEKEINGGNTKPYSSARRGLRRGN